MVELLRRVVRACRAGGSLTEPSRAAEGERKTHSRARSRAVRPNRPFPDRWQPGDSSRRGAPRNTARRAHLRLLDILGARAHPGDEQDFRESPLQDFAVEAPHNQTFAPVDGSADRDVGAGSG